MFLRTGCCVTPRVGFSRKHFQNETSILFANVSSIKEFAFFVFVFPRRHSRRSEYVNL